MNHNIFITLKENKENNNKKNQEEPKLSKTIILDTIPESRVESSLLNWELQYETEWRWRFLEINENTSIEISYKQRNNNIRIYCTQKGDWAEREVPLIYDKYVVQSYFCYT
jgi:hypothetical protein